MGKPLRLVFLAGADGADHFGTSGSRIFTGPIVRNPADYRYHMFYVVAGTHDRGSPVSPVVASLPISALER